MTRDALVEALTNPELLKPRQQVGNKQIKLLGAYPMEILSVYVNDGRIVIDVEIEVPSKFKPFTGF